MLGAKIIKKLLEKEILRHHKAMCALRGNDPDYKRKVNIETETFMFNYFKATGIDLHREHTGQKFPYWSIRRREDPDGIFHIRQGLFSRMWERLKGLMQNSPKI